MTQSAKKLASKTKQPSSHEMRKSIDAQVTAFLKGGGKIQRIPNGISGNNFKPSRHISLGKKPASTTPDTPQASTPQDSAGNGNETV